MKFKWEGAKATRTLMRQLGSNLDEAGSELATLIREVISIQGPPRSSPGQPPHIDTAKLIASYTHSTSTVTLTTYIGSPVLYAAYLEAGTPDMAARPHIVSTLIANQNDLARIICKS